MEKDYKYNKYLRREMRGVGSGGNVRASAEDWDVGVWTGGVSSTIKLGSS